MEYASDSGLGLPSKDYEILIDGFMLEANNFQTERKAYGQLALSVAEHAHQVNIPVVTYFVLEEEEDYSHFLQRIQQPKNVLSQEAERVCGRAILDGRYALNPAGKEKLHPVFEWQLFLHKSEWHLVRDALQMSGPNGRMRLVVRIGIPESITPETIGKDSMNTRLLIYRVWITTWAAFSKNGLGKNIAFQLDLD